MNINSINIKKLDKVFNMTLCKVNKQIIATIPQGYLDSVTRYIDGIDELVLHIPSSIIDIYTGENVKNHVYDLVKDERLICLNDNEYYVIKEDSYSSDEDKKVIKAYSLEHKLGKIDIKIEDIGLYLVGEDEELGIYSLDKYMKQETGWGLGHIDDVVRYDIVEDLTKTEKMRWQESVNKRWYDFIMDDVAKGFACIPVFDTKNKLVNLYDINSSGEKIQIYLSKDSYINTLERTDSAHDLTTRLYLVGNEEMDIIGATVTGYPYLENYSYFIENEEMSKELIDAILVYEARVAEHNIQWKKIIEVKLEKSNILLSKQKELYIVYEEIRALKAMVRAYESKKDEVNKAIAIAKISELNDVKVKLEVEIKALEDEVRALQSSIDELNILCKRETATDSDGYLIFNEVLLDELKEFVYCETYTNDSFLNVEDLLVAGKRELELTCKPTTSYSINVADFTKRIIDNGFRQHWDGELTLGDIIALYDNDLEKEVLQFFVGYTIRPNESDGLDLEISNKKVREDHTRTIADYLQDAKRSLSMVNSKKYIWNKTKYNRLNL